VSAEEALRRRVRRLIEAFNGPFGRMVAGLIAEGQSEPAILQEYDELLVSPRRAANLADLERGKAAGELRADTDTRLVADVIFGAIYYRLLLRTGPLTKKFSDELVEQVLRGHRSGPGRGRED
jgi:Tetracyclin repressor-like, C-terminal domain